MGADEVYVSGWGGVVLLVFSLLGQWALLKRILRLPVFFAPFAGCCLIIGTLYFFALLGILPLGAAVLYFSGLIAGGWLVVQGIMRRTLGQSKAHLRVPIFISLVALAELVWVCSKIPKGYYFHENDEYSHWALVTKIVAMSGALHGADSGIAFKSYPPGLAMLHYFFVHVIGYTEKNVLVAQILYSLSALLAASAFLLDKARSWLLGLLIFQALVVFSYMAGFTLYTINSDLPLAVTLSAGLAFLLCNGVDQRRAAISMALICVALVLIRPTGVVFSVFLIVMFVFMQLFGRQNLESAGNSGKWCCLLSPGRFATISEALVGTGIMCCATLMVFLSWRTYAKLIGGDFGGAARSWSYFFIPECGRVYLMLREFVEQMTERPAISLSMAGISIGASHVTLAVMLSLIGIVLWIISPKPARTATAIVVIGGLLGWYAYIAFQFYAYASFFSMYEAIRLASFDRYINVFYLAWVGMLLLLGADLYLSSNAGRRTVWLVGQGSVCVLLVFLCALSTSGLIQDFNGPAPDAGNSDLRKKIANLASIAVRHARLGDTAYYVGQNSKGYDFLMFRYLAAPLSQRQTWYWSFGKPYYDGDVWTMSDRTLGVAAGSYRFLVIGNADAQFWQENADLFAHPDPTITSGVYENLQIGRSLPLYVRIE